MPRELSAHDVYIKSKLAKTKQPALTLGPIHGISPFSGEHNPAFRSAISHRVWFTYRTAANGFTPHWAVTESAGEAVVALEVLMRKDLYGIEFQVLTVPYEFDGRAGTHTYDMRVTTTDGYRRLIFVRNGDSLSRPKTRREIETIAAATPAHAADDLIIVNTDDYPRQRRENVFRMYELLQDPDSEADNETFGVARMLGKRFRMLDVLPRTSLEQARVFRACYRLVAQGLLETNLNNVFHEHSYMKVA